jgi:archaellum component FlaF (FlaF/FlaG flagellin family)
MTWFRTISRASLLVVAATLLLSMTGGIVAGGSNNNKTSIAISPRGCEAEGAAIWTSISADGRFVAFYSLNTYLVPGDTNDFYNIFVHDQLSGVTKCITNSYEGEQSNGRSLYPTISADGRFVAFISVATNLVPEEPSHHPDNLFAKTVRTIKDIFNGRRMYSDNWVLYVYDQVTGITDLIAETTYASLHSSLSTDGRFLAYGTGSGIHVLDRIRGVSEHVLKSFASFTPSISADGRFVAFSSLDSNLVTGDTNIVSDVFVYDRVSDIVKRISISSSGIEGNDESRYPAISADGRYVAFSSAASNLVPGDTNGFLDIFVHDRVTSKTERVSVSSKGRQGNNEALWPDKISISADGRFVAFASHASNLVPGDTNSVLDIFVHDRLIGATERVSISSEGQQSNGSSITPSISANGRFVASQSGIMNLTPWDSSSKCPVVFIHDRCIDGSCASDPEIFNIFGYVKDTFNQPISGTIVADNAGHSATTASDGSFTIARMPAGLYTLTATRNDYYFGSVEVKIPLYSDALIFGTLK